MKTKYIGIYFLIIISVLVAENGKISGQTFFEYSMADSKSAFEINRVYFTYNNKVSDNIGYTFQLDVGREKIPISVVDSTFEVDKTRSTQLYSYLKNAKLSWKTGLGTMTFGLQGMNMFSVQEKNWGYRFIQKSPMDIYGYSSSADLGIGYSNTSGPLYSSILVTNGAGYKKPESDEYKKVSLNVVYGDMKLGKSNGYNAGVALSHEPTDTDPTQVIGLFGGVQLNALCVGGEFAKKDDGTDITTLTSLYGNFAMGTSLTLIGRLDVYDKDQYIIAGVNYLPESALSIAPTIRYTVPEKGDASTIYILNFQFKI